ncbi:MAG: substrate-binding domain-containing protein [Myxococcota bacterium]
MRNARRAAALSVLALLLSGAPAWCETEPLRVGVSWSNFQEERWKIDEAALEAGLEAHGAEILSTDAQSSTEKQLSDLENLLARGVDVLVVVAHDAAAIGPGLAAARAAGVPVLAYDRLIDAPDVFYLSFDNRRVGRLQAEQILAVQPRGRFVYIKGSPQDPNTEFVHAGQRDALAEAIAAGRVEIVGDQYVEGWLPEVAQRVMEQLLVRNRGEVDAVVCSNDAMAGGVSAALAAQGLPGIPVSGQDGDRAALNRIAKGLQTVSVWKDSRELGRRAAEVSRALARGVSPDRIEGAAAYTTPSGRQVSALLLEPLPITRDNLDRVIEAGWVTRAEVCRGVSEAGEGPPACVR